MICGFKPEYATGIKGRLPRRQSVCGLVSFLIGLLVVLAVPIVVWLGVITSYSRYGSTLSKWLAGLLIACPVLSVVGLSSGIVCLLEEQRKKALGIVGVVLNIGVVAIAVCCLVWVVSK